MPTDHADKKCREALTIITFKFKRLVEIFIFNKQFRVEILAKSNFLVLKGLALLSIKKIYYDSDIVVIIPFSLEYFISKW